MSRIIIQEELKAQYPSITHNENVGWALANIVYEYTNCFKLEDKTDIAELEQLELFYSNLYHSHQKTLKGRINTVRNTANFDISKVQDLPDDIIGVIKSYIEPELDYVKKLSVLDKFARVHRRSAPRAMERWLTDVPKERIVDLLRGDCMGIWINVNIAEPKDEWCNQIHNVLQTLTEYIDKPIAYLLKNNYRSLAMYRFLLHMKVFIDYRYKLEANKKANKEKLVKLKKTKILVNK